MACWVFICSRDAPNRVYKGSGLDKANSQLQKNILLFIVNVLRLPASFSSWDYNTRRVLLSLCAGFLKWYWKQGIGLHELISEGGVFCLVWLGMIQMMSSFVARSVHCSWICWDQRHHCLTWTFCGCLDILARFPFKLNLRSSGKGLLMETCKIRWQFACNEWPASKRHFNFLCHLGHLVSMTFNSRLINCNYSLWLKSSW